MTLSWQIVDSGSLLPEKIMAKDAWLLEQLCPQSQPILHLYEWQVPCLTYGYFTNPERHLYLPALERLGIYKARRPTGGGIIFHVSDLAFSVLIPSHHPQFSLNTLDNYALINQKVAEVITQFTQHLLSPHLLAQEPVCENVDCHAFCMAKPTQYDLMSQGKKIGGAAQRRTKQGLLHQSSLSLLFPPQELLEQVLKNHHIFSAMQQYGDFLLPSTTTVQDLQTARQQIKKLLIQFIPQI